MKRELWSEYRKTWKDFSQKLNQMQELADSGQSGPQVDSLFAELKQARMAHNAARDRLAVYLATHQSSREPLVAREQSIRRTARLIWEFSGKPENSAESDWHRAEELAATVSA